MRFHFWNTVLSLFFATLVVLSIAILNAKGRIYYGIPERDLFLMALAIFRLIRLFTYDHITQFIRDWFEDARKNSLRHTLGVLINCPWCIGLWFSWIIVTLYFSTIFSWPLILILSLAALASIFQILANWIGWNAEYKKIQTQQLTKEKKSPGNFPGFSFELAIGLVSAAEASTTSTVAVATPTAFLTRRTLSLRASHGY
jgi:hypothetical protein